ncbi:hypothetical protein [Nannocystis sp.]|uniref:hypothetical protein n=1 Tax=Nannocystis sp. TaxID=1962667 RepID=UPI002427CF63|nr:hypothetical protein [Nannocystis sp.]MBK7830038.1 hypothetical protein [Nannocystis sp.]MBK9752016.1 hypothetical protein [Nannocystis sp.]
MTPNQRMITIADLVSDAATRTIGRARAKHIAGKMTAEQFDQAVAGYDRAIEHAARLTTAALHQTAVALSPLTTALEESVERIKQAVQRIDRTSDVLTILGKLLGFAAAIVLAVAAPALIPGAVAAGVTLATTIHAVASDDE